MTLNKKNDGIIIVDKPKGITSNQVSIWLKKLLNEKTGHCGTLDPNVSGVLPVLIGRGVKLQEFLQAHNKEYICLMETEKEVSKNEIEKVFENFSGKIYQKPPEISAVSKDIRVRHIFEIKLIEIKKNLVLFSVYCQHGTYIRKIVKDIGLFLAQKTKMLELRRSSVNGFKENETTNMFKIKDMIETKNEEKIIKSMEFAVQSLPKVNIDSLEEIKYGKKIKAQALKNWKGHIVKDTAVAVFFGEKLTAVCESLVDNPQKREKRKLLQPVKVFI